MTKKPRKIVVFQENYLWTRKHFHLETYTHAPCVEQLMIYREGYKKSPLKLLFKEEDNWHFKDKAEEAKWCVGYPEEGVLWYYQLKQDPRTLPKVNRVNLNRPAVIACLIRYFTQGAWKPKEQNTPLLMEDALKLMDQLDWPLALHGT